MYSNTCIAILYGIKISVAAEKYLCNVSNTIELNIYSNFARKRLVDFNPTFRFFISFSRIEFFTLKIF